MGTRIYPILTVALMLSMSLSAIVSSQEDMDNSDVLTKETPSYSSHSSVAQFGSGFDEIVIVNSQLYTPRDMEFHPNPSRSDELWIINRGDGSITIVQNTGQGNQNILNRQDEYADHFMADVSALAFGQWDAEFDNIFSTAQESRNGGNNFMGPALWPSSLSHFAMEHQNDADLGSHLDMLHESPYGMGIAWDQGNAYWYFDGYYGELVYYDFVQDHDTGQDDHDDGIVRRHSEITLTRRANVPGHMILDQSNGILYIADTGAGRVLWVNTDDTSTQSQNIYNSQSHPARMETLAEYSDITGMEFGVLVSGLSQPSGIALDGDTLFVSQNGNGKISAYDLASNGKSGTHLQTVDTNANSIMGLEIGPDDKLWYVDAGMNRVMRLDPYPDSDSDGVRDSADNCPNTPNPTQDNHDGDSQGNLCDSDDDNDGLTDDVDDCLYGLTGWTSSSSTDYDNDGCRDNTAEDTDDDNDGIEDMDDICTKGALDWQSDAANDYDSDGCRDDLEDYDDDNDAICDSGGPYSGWQSCTAGWPGMDRCPLGRIGFRSNPSTDQDHDGCEDLMEDDDDDDDGFTDSSDSCPEIAGTADQGINRGCPDLDGDGWADIEDEWPFDATQWIDTDSDGYGDNPAGTDPDGCPTFSGTSTFDRLGCPDSDDDGWSNPDAMWTAADGADAFPADYTQWMDSDEDGYGDNSDGLTHDSCPNVFGTSTIDRYGCIDSDGDGWSDSADAFPNEYTQWEDSDGDGFGDSASGVGPDECPLVSGTSTSDVLGCPDTDFDTWSDLADVYAMDPLLWSDGDNDGFADQQGTNLSDDCVLEWGNATEDRRGCIDSDGDGVSDEADFYPLDASRSVEESAAANILLIGFVVFLVFAVGLISVLGIMLIRRRGSSAPAPSASMMPMPMPLPTPQPMPEAAAQPLATPEPAAYQQPPVASGPPIPPEGIPPGWTMEQWQYYGAEWLVENNR